MLGRSIGRKSGALPDTSIVRSSFRLALALAVAGPACGGKASEHDRPSFESPTGSSTGGSPSSGGSAGMGGGSAGNRDTTTGGGSAGNAAQALALRFDQIAVGRDRFCGITRDDARLVCVTGDQIESDRPGPYIDIAISEDVQAWSYLCAVLATGELECDGLDLPLPAGPFHHVTLGFFNACARGPAGAACWVGPQIGGIEPPAGVGDDFTVEMYSYCHRPEPLHAQCYSRGLSLLPEDAHYIDAVAGPESACAALYASPSGIVPDTVDPELVEVMSKSQIVCFTKNGIEVKRTGAFASLDVDVNLDGCAIRSGDRGVECWGRSAEAVPVRDMEAVQVAVSTSLSCVLWKDGRVNCW